MRASVSDLTQSSTSSPSEDETKPLHIVFHLPRCAGQTIHHHLSGHAPAGSYFRVRKRKGAGRVFLPKYRATDLPDLKSLNVISGHWIGRSIEQNFPGRHIARSLLLRDPVSQFLSHYNFRMMRYIARGLSPYPLEIAYGARQRNFLTHFILRTFAEMSWQRLLTLSAADKYAEANRFLSNFFFVGDHRRCNELIASIAPDLGIPEEAQPRNTSEQWLERVDWKRLEEHDLPRGIIDRIKEDNMLDQMLWEAWKDANGGGTQPRPHSFSEDSLVKRVAVQSSRLINQARRRYHRGWKLPVGQST